MEYAIIWRRFLASMIDVAILSILYLVLRKLFNLNAGEPLVETFMFLLGVVYYACFESSILKATLGKLLLKLCVGNEQGKRLQLPHAIARATAYYTPLIPYVISNYFTSDILLLSKIYVFGFVIVLVFISTVFFTKEKKAIYDMISKSRVFMKKSS